LGFEFWVFTVSCLVVLNTAITLRRTIPDSMRTSPALQPSGSLHIGNYFVPCGRRLKRQARGECFISIADYHSMTSLFDPAERRRNTLDVAIDWLACGRIRSTACFGGRVRAEVVELIVDLGLHAERATQLQDRRPRHFPELRPFRHPVLMAPSIFCSTTRIAYRSQGPEQHLEMTRDIAINSTKLRRNPGVPEAISRGDRRRARSRCQKMSKKLWQHDHIFGDRRERKSWASDGLAHAANRSPMREQNLAISSSSSLVAPADVARDFETAPRRRARLRRPEEGPVEHYLNYFTAAGSAGPSSAANRDHVEAVYEMGDAVLGRWQVSCSSGAQGPAGWNKLATFSC